MTGRYNCRTGVVDTYLGRSMMYPDEVTMAECLASAGYRTGIFGKWHRAIVILCGRSDQGFQEAVICKGGGVGQPSDPPGNSYFDPILHRNGVEKKYTGYCTDLLQRSHGFYLKAPEGAMVLLPAHQRSPRSARNLRRLCAAISRQGAW